MAGRRRPGAAPIEGIRGLPAIGPGAKRKAPDRAWLAEQAMARAHHATWRKVWCGGKDCAGHVVREDGHAVDAERCA